TKSEPYYLQNVQTTTKGLRVGYMSKNRSMYCPLQPAVTENDEQVRYREFFPPPVLQRYVYCCWELQTLQPLPRPPLSRVVADGCIDIAFNMRGPQESIVMGFHDTYNEFSLEPEFYYVGVRFLPAMFPLAFAMDASQLSNCLQPLDYVLP